jgi:hypothetical protein
MPRRRGYSLDVLLTGVKRAPPGWPPADWLRVEPWASAFAADAFAADEGIAERLRRLGWEPGDLLALSHRLLVLEVKIWREGSPLYIEQRWHPERGRSIAIRGLEHKHSKQDLDHAWRVRDEWGEVKRGTKPFGSGLLMDGLAFKTRFRQVMDEIPASDHPTKLQVAKRMPMHRVRDEWGEVKRGTKPFGSGLLMDGRAFKMRFRQVMDEIPASDHPTKLQVAKRMPMHRDTLDTYLERENIDFEEAKLDRLRRLGLIRSAD